MPFQSKSQARGAFSGAFGSKMKADAQQWADETPGGIKSLPDKKAEPAKKSPPKPEAKNSAMRGLFKANK